VSRLNEKETSINNFLSRWGRNILPKGFFFGYFGSNIEAFFSAKLLLGPLPEDVRHCVSFGWGACEERHKEARLA